TSTNNNKINKITFNINNNANINNNNTNTNILRPFTLTLLIEDELLQRDRNTSHKVTTNPVVL
ncbi:hypothetical protein SK128_005390, partial [Halocaridina rubra]